MQGGRVFIASGRFSAVCLAALLPFAWHVSTSEAQGTRGRTAPQLTITSWEGPIDARNAKFFRFVKSNQKKIVRIDGSSNDQATEYNADTKKCVIGSRQSDGTGTEYIVDCTRRAGEWRIRGFFTQQEWVFKRGVMTIEFDRVPDGVILSQNPRIPRHNP
jgi:hypothetical protein